MPDAALAQAKKRSFIRDAETETIIRTLATPLFQAAGMPPSTIGIRLVQDNSLNAFVANGRNIYLHTGLILESGTVDGLLGVIAHETGHIEGGHLVRTRAAIEEARMIQMIGTILGTAAAVGSGRADVGQAVIMGSQSSGTNVFLKYSRTQESAADQAAMRLLDATERSSRGLSEFLGKLEGQEILTNRLQDPYVQTHPLSRERIDALGEHLRNSPYAEAVPDQVEVLLHARMVAKLYGFIKPFGQVLKRYPETDQTFAARYARAVAYFRKADLDTALKLMAELLAEAPEDPYLHELKGQMLFEHARPDEALAAYREAFRLAPFEALIALELARVELETDDPAQLESAIEHFRHAIRKGSNSSFTWQQLGIAYGRAGDMAMSALALAESELRAGQLANAEFHAARAEARLEKGSPSHLQAQDILQAIKIVRERKANAAK